MKPHPQSAIKSRASKMWWLFSTKILLRYGISANLNKEYLTPSEVAVLLNIGRTSIYRYIRNGVIKVIRFERKTLLTSTMGHYQKRFSFIS